MKCLYFKGQIKIFNCSQLILYVELQLLQTKSLQYAIE